MRQGGGGGRASSPPRGALAGIRRDAKASSVTGATPLPSGGAWSNCAWRSLVSLSRGGGCATPKATDATDIVLPCAAFLNGKAWHPMNYRNQKALFEAEQLEAKRREADAKAKAEFAEQAELFRNLATLPGKERQRLQAAEQVAFMYQKPPGYDAMREREAAAPAAQPSGEGDAAAAASDGRPRLGAPVVRVQCLRCRGFGHEASACQQPRVGQPLLASRLLEDPLTLMRARAELATHAKFEYRGVGVDARPADAQLLLDDGAEVPGQGHAARPPETDALAALVHVHASGGDEAVRATLEAMPEKQRKRLIRAYDRLRKAERRAREQAAVAAARAFLDTAAAGGDARHVADTAGLGHRSKRRKRHPRRDDEGDSCSKDNTV